MKHRRLARHVALQALFEVDAVGHDPERALQYRLEESSLAPEHAAFARRLVWGVLQHRATIDDLIQRHAPLWPINDVAIVDRNILRIGTLELLWGETPPRVAINEAVELGKHFGSDSTHRFVNGVLASILEELEASGRLGELRDYMAPPPPAPSEESSQA
ncbi:MAG: transcription antitermination factor NusB [Anaerolineae bacterium]|nr:transcription antitermination factor NusB [Anaerolineae bacterium]